MSGSQTMSEKDFLRKKEMQDRAFLQWVTRKNEEEKARKAAIKLQEEQKIEQQRQKIMMGKAAYSQWIKLQKEKDTLLVKQKRRENEQTRLEHQEHLENLKKAQETFEIWKAQKDLEQQLAQEGNADNSVELKRSNTPTVPGYCSVWVCDDEMRKHICTAVPRPP